MEINFVKPRDEERLRHFHEGTEDKQVSHLKLQ